MNAPRPLPPEDDLFARVAVHNKLLTSKQLDECVQAILDDVIAGRPRPSLPSVLAEKKFMSARNVAAVQAVIKAYATKQAGVATQLPKLKLKSHAPAGDSQIFVNAKSAGADHERFVHEVSKPDGWAKLTLDCYRLTTADQPDLEAACRQLLGSGQERLHVDTRKLGMVTDETVRILLKVATDAVAAGRSLVLYCEEGTAQMTRTIFKGQVEVLTDEPPQAIGADELPPVPRIDTPEQLPPVPRINALPRESQPPALPAETSKRGAARSVDAPSGRPTRKFTSDKRFSLVAPKKARVAKLVIDCVRMDAGDAPRLEAACNALIGSSQERLEIDVRRVDSLSSMEIAILGKYAMEASKAGKHVILHCIQSVAKAVRLVLGNRINVKVGDRPKGPSLRRRNT